MREAFSKDRISVNCKSNVKKSVIEANKSLENANILFCNFVLWFFFIILNSELVNNKETKIVSKIIKTIQTAIDCTLKLG